MGLAIFWTLPIDDAVAQEECGTLVYASPDTFIYDYASCPRQALIVRIDKSPPAVVDTFKCKIAARLDIVAAGYYQIFTTIEYSGG